MMKITVLSVGKIKEAYLRDAIAEYAKRLGRYCNLTIVETVDERTPDGASQAVCDAIRRKEGERLLKKLPEGSLKIVLDIKGKELSSEAFARKLGDYSVAGVSHIVFVIGGSLGLSDEVKACADYTLSFSPMTFPHQLMRVILLEQIYRAYRILNGEPYHK